MLRRSPFAAAVAVLLALVALPSGASRGQSLDKGTPELERQFREVRTQFNNLLKGETAPEPTNEQHKKAFTLAAKNVLYHIYYVSLNPKPGEVDKLVAENEANVNLVLKPRSENQTKDIPSLARMYTRAILDVVPEILQEAQEKKKPPLVTLNVARVVAYLVRLAPHDDKGQTGGQLADTLLALVNDKDPADAKKALRFNDGVHYWALRGLRDLLAIPVPPAPQPPVLSKAKEEAIALALLDFLDRKVSFPPDTPRQEVEGYRMLRREAVRALARSRYPALSDKGRPALALLQFVAGDARVSPPPRLDERLEAAIGLARMPRAAAKDYQPDYAAFWIGVFVVDFAKEAGANSKAAQPTRLRPWRYDAARFKDALEAMKADAKDKYVTDMVDRAAKILADVENGRAPTTENLTSWLGDPATPANPPPSKELFKDSPDTAVKLPAAALETKPEKSDKPKKDDKPKKKDDKAKK